MGCGHKWYLKFFSLNSYSLVTGSGDSPKEEHIHPLLQHQFFSLSYRFGNTSPVITPDKLDLPSPKYATHILQLLLYHLYYFVAQ